MYTLLHSSIHLYMRYILCTIKLSDLTPKSDYGIGKGTKEEWFETRTDVSPKYFSKKGSRYVDALPLYTPF